MGVKVLKGDEFVTDGVSITNTDHSAFHKGYAYAFEIFESQLSGAGVVEYSLKTPLQKYVHLKNLAVKVKGGNAKVEFLKDVTVTVDTGASVDIVQQNHNSTNTAETTIKASPTFTGGTALKTMRALADATNQSVTSSSFSLSDTQEIVTKNNEEYYVIRITNLEALNAIDVVLDGWFYEEPKGLA